MFLVFINDLPNCLSDSQPRMYTQMILILRTPAMIYMYWNLNLTKIWKTWLNMTKTEYMLIGSRQRLRTLSENPNLKINIVPINRVSTTKSLGVVIDENLTCRSSHIDKLTKKVASGIGAIKRLRSFVSSETLYFIYHALIQPHFDYCNVVWGNCGKTLANQLQKLQNRAARVLTFSNFDADASGLMENLGWDNLNTQRQIQKASIHGLTPEYLHSKFTNRSDVTNYSLRDSVNKLAVPLPRTNYLKNSFSYSGAVLWNGLPSNIRQAESLNEFRRLLKCHIR